SRPEKRSYTRAEGLQALGPERIGGALAGDEGALPVAAAVEHDQRRPRLDAPPDGAALLGPSREPEPQHVPGAGHVPPPQPPRRAQRRVAAVGGDDEVGVQLLLA